MAIFWDGMPILSSETLPLILSPYITRCAVALYGLFETSFFNIPLKTTMGVF